MKDFLYITKALADSNRIRALLALRDRELCVCQLIELLELAPSTVSKHMSILGQSGLVESQKRGRWVYYRLAGKKSSKLVSAAITLTRKSLDTDPQIEADAIRLQKILKQDPETLCKRQG